MMRVFRFSPARLALSYIVLGLAVLLLFAVPLWYAWNTNVATFREYVRADELARLTAILEREGPRGLVAAIDSRASTFPEDTVMILADASKARLAGNLSVWPGEVPDAAGTYGLVIGVGGGGTMRIVATHVRLPGGHHLLIGRESARFRSLVDLFQYGIAGAVGTVMVLGAALGWAFRRALLSEVQAVSRAAAAVAAGDATRRLPTDGGSSELDALAQTVNGMLERLATQNARLEGEVAVRRQAEEALHRAHDDLEALVAQRTAQLAQANESLERALRETERQKAHLDELFDLAPDAIVLTSVNDPRTLRINREFTRMFGYASEEVVGNRLRPLVVPDDASRLTGEADFIAGSKVELESMRKRKDGTRFHAHMTAKRVSLQGAEDAAYMIYRDISERKHAEEALRLSEERYARAMEATDEGHFEWNVVTDDLFVSPRGRQLLGRVGDSAGLGDLATSTPYDPHDSGALRIALVGGVSHTLFHPVDRARVRNGVVEALAGIATRLDIEFRIIPQPGELRWLHVRWKITRNDAGAPLLVTGVLTDITERRRAEEALRALERRRRQAQRLESMGTLAGGIAHDFNNILGAILGYGEMALRDAAPGSKLRRDLDSIIAAGERGRTLVDRILTFSRSGVGERVLVHVEKVVREALDHLGPTVPREIAIEARLEAGRAAMLGEPTQVHQVLMNLVTNGIQAMPAGGTLRVSLTTQRFDAERVATMGTVGAGDYILLEVADTGTGIAPEILDRIFDPFFTTKEVNVGNGLGLSIVHGIISEVDGAIDVASKPGAGSVFTVCFPRSGDAAEERESTERQLPRGAGQRVLIVDDEEPLVRLATETLDELGYEAVGFSSSAAALDAFRANPDSFNAVITDERMPGINGSSLIREVRRLRLSIPILLVSGYVGGMVAGRAYNEGADEVLKKPLSARDLGMALARVLAR